MKKPILLSMLSSTLLLLILVSPPFCFAAGPHGGFGGGGFHGGGFHGGGWGGGWHGGSWGGGWHGAGWGGWHGGFYPVHGGYYPWHGAFWGYPGWGWGGWGIGIGVSFGWGGGYWPSYPYYAYPPPGYGSHAWVPACPTYYPCYPYSPYPYYVPVSNPNQVRVNHSTANAAAYVRATSHPQPAPVAAQRGTEPSTIARPSDVRVVNASYKRADSIATIHAPARPGDASVGYSSTQLNQLRPEVQNVIRALRAMPPAVRRRQIESGRYSNLSPQELEFAMRAAAVPPAR